ncbi:SDR family NAD(P)-dependent oxidoreductase [Pseudalkalibacillus decolorationis]|uniref:SDR family NAD(P)-dependent oxidoreductase n=1 Tax=Pseudalkalibacillus decolorationis TaxID=163879 RepID=UPI0021498160|nr:SDR family oxidoreductase [Pseudalkalibacillus decolorationis]
MAKLKDAIAVVTGAGSGIGQETAIRFAEEGARVILVGRTSSKLERVADRINSHLPEQVAEVFRADVTNEEDVQNLAQFIQKKYGDLHVLVNNAGVSSKSTILEMETSEWDRIQDTNLKSTFLVSKILGKVIADGRINDKDSGNVRDRAIVNVASLSGHKAGAQIPHYSSSKAGVINFTKALAVEFSQYGIRVNSVSPGYTITPLTEEGLKNNRFEEAIKRHTALKRVGKPKEIANVIAFAASSEASYMTGSDLLVDGGWLVT